MKFKVWDKLKSKWSTRSFFIGQDGKLYVWGKVSGGFYETKPRYKPIYSTETNDKNGVEWWQGDLFYSITYCLIEIVWHELGWSLKYRTGIRATGLTVAAHPHLLAKSEKIGTKFENPELLET